MSRKTTPKSTPKSTKPSPRAEVVHQGASDAQPVEQTVSPERAQWERDVSAREALAHAVITLAAALDELAQGIAAGFGPLQTYSHAPPPVAPLAEVVQKVERVEAAREAEERKEERKPAGKAKPQGAEPTTLEDVRKAIRAAVKAGEGQKVVDCLKSLGAEAASDLKPEQYHLAHAQLVALVPVQP